MLNHTILTGDSSDVRITLNYFEAMIPDLHLKEVFSYFLLDDSSVFGAIFLHPEHWECLL